MGGNNHSVTLKSGDNQIRLQLAEKMLALMADLLLLHERDLKVKYKEMTPQIERIHGLQMNAKYVGLSGTKNIVVGLWLLSYAFLTPKTQSQQMQVMSKTSLLNSTTPIKKSLLSNIQATCHQVMAASNYLQRDPSYATQPNFMSNLIGYNEETIMAVVKKALA